MKYEVTTVRKTLIKTTNLDEAMKVAEEASKTNSYVEVKAVTMGVNGWYSKSVKILYR